MIEMVVDSIRVSLMNYQRMVLLKETDADRYLPIWIGRAEADAIAVRLQGVSVPRPLTHDLIQSLVDKLGGRVNSIVVCDRLGGYHHSTIATTRKIEAEPRPSASQKPLAGNAHLE